MLNSNNVRRVRDVCRQTGKCFGIVSYAVYVKDGLSKHLYDGLLSAGLPHPWSMLHHAPLLARRSASISCLTVLAIFSRLIHSATALPVSCAFIFQLTSI